MKTPIFIDFETTYQTVLGSNEINLFKSDPVDIYTDPLDVSISDKGYVLAPRYYMLITPPANQPSAFPIRIDIHKSPGSLLRNQSRVLLNPSTGFGINASYKVEYFEYIPRINLPGDITQRKILEEWWYVPTIDECTYVPMFPFDPRQIYPLDFIVIEPFDQPQIKCEDVPVQRIDNLDGTVSDTIDSRDYSHIFHFKPDGATTSVTTNVATETLAFNAQTLTWTFSKRLDSTVLLRDASLVTGAIADGPVTTQIEYIVPFHPEQIRLLPEHLKCLTEHNFVY